MVPHPESPDERVAPSVVDTILAHSSVRRYHPEPVPEDHIELLIEVMRGAPTPKLRADLRTLGWRGDET